MPSRRSAPCFMVAFVLGFLALSASRPALAADPALSVAGTPDGLVRGSAPVTVTLRPSADLRNALRKIPDRPADSPTVRLAVSGVKAPGGASIRVFLNLPRAGAATGTDDPHYIGAMTSFEDSPAGSPGDDYILDLGAAGRDRHPDPGRGAGQRSRRRRDPRRQDGAHAGAQELKGGARPTG